MCGCVYIFLFPFLIYIYIYIYISVDGSPAENKKGIETQRAKPLTSTWAIDALIGEEKQTGKEERRETKKQGKGLLRSAGIIR